MKRNALFFWTLLCIAAGGSAAIQFDFAGTLQQKLRLYYDRHIPVKIHLTFNQPKYDAGDTAYYKINLFTAEHYRLIGGRQIATVKLLNDQREVVRQSKVLLKDGVGFNQIPIGEDLLPGRYCVVAYNETMRGGDPTLVFQSPLWIAGPSTVGDATPNEILFYPEGGKLIGNITNKIIVRGPANSTGTVFSETGDKVISFVLDRQGIGLFFLAPQNNMKYSAVLHENNAREDLPLVEDDGAGMLVTVPLNKSPIRVTVQVPANSQLKSENLNLSLTSHAKVYSVAELAFIDKHFLTFAFPQEDLPEGIARFSIFKADGSILSERLIYIHNDSSPKVEINVGTGVFSVRDQIPLVITLTANDEKSLSSDLAVTVYKDDFTEAQKSRAKNIVDNALLFGDLSGSLNTAEDFSTRDTTALLALDNYLITQKWNRYSWEDVWTEKLSSRAFRKYLHLEGRAFQTDGKPLPDSTVITFFLQKTVMVYEVLVDRLGAFDFSMLIDFYGEEEIFYRAESRGYFLPNVLLSLDTGIQFDSAFPNIKNMDTPDSFYIFSQQREKIDRSYSFHLLEGDAYEKPTSLNALIEEEVFGADIVINMDDYFLFPTMSETLREIVPMLQHRKNKNRDVIKLFLDDRDRFAEEQPLIIVDGVITDNTTYLINLKPVEVASIKIINSLNKLRAFGSIGKNGVVLVETKIEGNAAHVPRSDYTVNAQGFTAPSGHFRSAPPIKVPRVPDLRTNLYWNPTLKTDSRGRASTTFGASDVTGRYKVKVEGFTEAGKPLHAEKTFQVLFNSD